MNFQTIKFSILITILINIEPSVGVPQKHGQLARKLDEYFGTIKCMANIFEDLIPGKFAINNSKYNSEN